MLILGAAQEFTTISHLTTVEGGIYRH